MAVKFNLRMCLQLMDQGISLNTIHQAKSHKQAHLIESKTKKGGIKI